MKLITMLALAFLLGGEADAKDKPSQVKPALSKNKPAPAQPSWGITDTLALPAGTPAKPAKRFIQTGVIFSVNAETHQVVVKSTDVRTGNIIFAVEGTTKISKAGDPAVLSDIFAGDAAIIKFKIKGNKKIATYIDVNIPKLK